MRVFFPAGASYAPWAANAGAAHRMDAPGIDGSFAQQAPRRAKHGPRELRTFGSRKRGDAWLRRGYRVEMCVEKCCDLTVAFRGGVLVKQGCAG